MFKTITLFILMGLLKPQSGFSQDLLDSLIRVAMRENLSIRSESEVIGIARSKVVQSGAWEPPQTGVEFYETPTRSFPIPTKQNMETDYFVQQTFPWPGKIPAMRKAAETGVKVAESNYDVIRKSIILDVKLAFYELYGIRRRIAINRDQQTLIRSLIDLALKRYETGMGKASDVVRTQTELANAIEENVDLSKDERTALSMLNALLNRLPDDTIPDVPEVTIEMPHWETSHLVMLSERHRDELSGMRLEGEMNRSELLAARREGYPDIMAKIQYKDFRNTSKDFWSLMVGVSLPVAWWSRGSYQGKIREYQSKINIASIEVEKMKTMLRAEIASGLAAVETAHHHAMYHRDVIIPQTHQILSLTLADYQSGKTELYMVVDAYRMLLMARSDYVENSVQFLAARARLERTVGLSSIEITQSMKDSQ